MTTENELTAIVDEWLMLVKETGEFHPRPEVKAVFLDVQKTLAGIRRRLESRTRRYIVATVGLTNVGKSTLLNALLGAELAPRRNRPCTTAPIEFTFGEDLLITAYHDASIHRPTWQCQSHDEIHQRLGELAGGNAGDQERTIRRVVVRAPLPLLQSGLVIADTPGFGAAQVGDAAGTHEAALRRYLIDDVRQVFWVVLADQGIGKREKAFHDEFFADVCNDVVVTGCEDWEQSDRQRFRSRFSSMFGSRLPTFHFVSGRQGCIARRTNDELGLEEAGITLLENRIRELAAPQGRSAAMGMTLRQLAEDLGFWLGEFRDDRRLPLRHWWRLDSWVRWYNVLPRCELKAALTRSLREVAHE